MLLSSRASPPRGEDECPHRARWPSGDQLGRVARSSRATDTGAQIQFAPPLERSAARGRSRTCRAVVAGPPAVTGRLHAARSDQARATPWQRSAPLSASATVFRHNRSFPYIVRLYALSRGAHLDSVICAPVATPMWPNSFEWTLEACAECARAPN